MILSILGFALFFLFTGAVLVLILVLFFRGVIKMKIDARKRENKTPEPPWEYGKSGFLVNDAH